MSSRDTNIVVVEDDAGMRQAIERLLSVAGFHPRSFADGPTLITSSAARSAQCLVLDVQLQRDNGFDLYQRLLEMGVDCPVVFITAYEGAESRRRAFVAGGAFLPKPFAGRELVDMIGCAIEAHERRHQRAIDPP